MSYRLLLLGILADRPRYGYEIKQTFESGSFAAYVKLSGGGLYYNLHKLSGEGYIAEEVVEREGNYPDRHIYALTESGRHYFKQLLQQTFADGRARAFFDPLDAALLFGSKLSKAEVLFRLQHLIDGKRSKLAQIELLQEVLAHIKEKLDPYELLLLDHSIYRGRNDLNWLEATIAQIESDPHFAASYASSQVSETSEGEQADTAQPQQEWFDFEDSLEHLVSVYERTVAEAWRTYEAVVNLPTSSPERLLQARSNYRQRIDEAWRDCQEQLAAKREFMTKLLRELESQPQPD
jgi:DNA-binding PadR family transcriptional regulator